MKSNVEDDRGRAARILALLEHDDREWLQDRLAEPWRRRARRLEERDRLIREFGLAFHPLLSGRAMAAAIAVELGRYRASGFRFEVDLAAPGDQRRAALWKILHLNNRRNLSQGAVRTALAGIVVVGQKRNRKLATERATAARFGLKSGTNRDACGSEATNR